MQYRTDRSLSGIALIISAKDAQSGAFKIVLCSDPVSYTHLDVYKRPIVGWPFGVFLMKQFSEGIPTEMLEDVYKRQVHSPE